MARKTIIELRVALKTTREEVTIMMTRELKSIRVRKDLTQEEIAEKLEMSVTAYSKRENGHIEFSVSEVRKVKEVLNLSDEEVIRIFFENEVA